MNSMTNDGLFVWFGWTTRDYEGLQWTTMDYNGLRQGNVFFYDVNERILLSWKNPKKTKKIVVLEKFKKKYVELLIT